MHRIIISAGKQKVYSEQDEAKIGRVLLLVKIEGIWCQEEEGNIEGQKLTDDQAKHKQHGQLLG